MFIVDQIHGQFRPVGNDQNRSNQDKHKRYGCPIQLSHWFMETITGNEQIHADRGGEISDLHISKEDNTEVDRVNIVTDSDGQ